MKDACPHQIWRHQAAVKQHGKENIEADHISEGQFSYRQSIGCHRWQNQVAGSPHNGHKNGNSIGSENGLGVTENILISLQAEFFGYKRISIDQQGSFRGNGGHKQ